ncbi:MAG: tetratricopeptide repeat protein [Alphaproteobacteria bacterium]
MSSSQDVRDGAALIDKGEFDKGVALTLRALEDQLSIQDIAAAYTNLCSADVQRQRYEEAMENCEKALKIDKSMPEALNNIATIRYMQGDYKASVELYRKALRSKPFDDLIMGNLLLAQRKLDEVERKTAPATPQPS